MATLGQPRPVSSFAAIQAEEQARAAHRSAAAGPPQDGGDDGFEEQLARAMRESLESSTPASTAPAADVDGDYALALALAAAEEAAVRESAAAASVRARGGAPGRGGGHATVKLLSQLEHSLNAAVSLRSAATGPQRTLYSAEDADALRAAASAAAASAGEGGRHEAALAHTQAAEADDDELRRALRGRGLARVASDSHDDRGGLPAASHAGSKPSGAVASALVSKHDSELSARLTARRLERDLGPVAAGELCAADGAPARIAPSAVVSLKRHLQKQQVKGTAAHGA